MKGENYIDVPETQLIYQSLETQVEIERIDALSEPISKRM